MKAIAYFFILILCLSGCAEQGSTSDPEGGYWVLIQNAAGDDFISEGSTYISYPYNKATFRQIDNEQITCAVISKQLSKGKKINVEPMGMLTYNENNEPRYCIVAVPTDTSLMNIQINNFSDFMLKYAPVRNIIELWELNKCGNGCSKMMGWKDENAAGLLLEKNIER